MRRKQIINRLVDTLKLINAGVDTSELSFRSPYTFQTNINNNAFDAYKFADELNDFPSVCVYNSVDSISHIGGGVKYGVLAVSIRGYVRDGDDVITEAEKLVDDLEYIVNNFRYRARDLCVVDSRIHTLETDEGLMEPFGVVNIEAQISYERE